MAAGQPDGFWHTTNQFMSQAAPISRASPTEEEELMRSVLKLRQEKGRRSAIADYAAASPSARQRWHKHQRTKSELS